MARNLRALAAIASLCLPISLAVAQPVSQQCVNSEVAKKEVLELDSMRIDALLRNDVEFLEEITADDYSHVESSGGARNKSQFIAGRRGERALFSTFVIDENKATIYCNVVVGRYHNAHRTSGGSSVVKRARHLRVYVHENGQWRNVAHQATEIGRAD
ncbi:MAG: nuclear transport factor 2 family protein [Mesorhizobium sp.]|uniref:nuclear transport factor 2 family protein n=1 Tax=Mesorhizobium sp. TaxID=1871066 RepID=UPI000FE703B7|nr:nuclear transport factor 2 family protein [Mesorhizobium sp.]RWQ34499.1 MAG: nuclear transport factor 2 family protein [Mesorhizobium sp.]TIL23604.1 MAG: nuclear transport factor 2 family protein [Mesorhizobium sp.]